MGNAAASTLGISAIALTTPNLEKKEIEGLAADMKAYADENNTTQIPKSVFEAVLARMEKLEPSDVDLLMKLFTMFDLEGELRCVAL
jgi:hypothetical protein